jgi:hypothetical protein
MALPIKCEVGRGKVTILQVLLTASEVATDSVDATQDVAVADAEIGDVVSICVENETLTFAANAYVSARGVVTIQIVNATGDGVEVATTPANLIVFHRN